MPLFPIAYPRRLRAGDVVEVRPEAEILATLGPDATLDGLPFMPEMLHQCGSRFTVAGRADTTCFYGVLRDMDAAVHLTGVRCDGSAHGGCQAGCLMYWKEEWLRPVEPARDGAARHPIALPEPRVRGECSRSDVLRAVHPPETTDGEELWSCQATQVRAATTPIRPWDLRHYVRDVLTRNVRLRQVLRWIVPSLVLTYQWVSRGYLPRWLRVAGGADIPFVHGRLERTPLTVLGLQPGEPVRVKDLEDVRATLDGSGRNRGLSFDVEMIPYCGQSRRVDRVVTRTIDEWTGRLLQLKGRCIVLDGAVCTGRYHGLCSRQSEPYWREAWLEREPEGQDPRRTTHHSTAGAAEA
ncbi:hypothetical protein [Geodermatophilus normandii]|uniref:hypothetical protein n=1 Tax=Geodermatophilus normandii TaxID=1137989 RepID=UPI001953A281|nr:hypothetical protein [Geodermatophilus normandii]